MVLMHQSGLIDLTCAVCCVRSLAVQSATSRAALTQRCNATSGAVVARRAYATWSDVAPRGWSQHSGFRVMQQRGADVDPMTVVYTLMGASPTRDSDPRNARVDDSTARLLNLLLSQQPPLDGLPLYG